MVPTQRKADLVTLEIDHLPKVTQAIRLLKEKIRDSTSDLQIQIQIQAAQDSKKARNSTDTLVKAGPKSKKRDIFQDLSKIERMKS